MKLFKRIYHNFVGMMFEDDLLKIINEHSQKGRMVEFRTTYPLTDTPTFKARIFEKMERLKLKKNGKIYEGYAWILGKREKEDKFNFYEKRFVFYDFILKALEYDFEHYLIELTGEQIEEIEKFSKKFWNIFSREQEEYYQKHGYPKQRCSKNNPDAEGNLYTPCMCAYESNCPYVFVPDKQKIIKDLLERRCRNENS